MSFRVEALLGIGGFWPAVGQPELRDWFSEEHYAQHELAAAGWSAHEESTLAATRLLDPAALPWHALLALRARYGARSALVGGHRERVAAARTATISAAGVVAALSRRGLGTCSERAGRATENVGVLFAGPLGRPGLQPDSDRTPFRHSMPRPLARRRLPRSPGPGAPLVLVYHRVDDAPGAGVPPQTFAAQIEFLARTARR